MEGTIKRIKLHNFVTYDSVECRPGQNLNIIIGPNGTGKSTIVSAIVLGLGEKPQVTGRGKKAQEFIKTGKKEAKITLELHPDHVIERRITIDGKSTYKLNSNIVSEKDIQAFTKQLNIQVSNLCQFLPQDRVKEFAGMNHKELLINTEKAVGGEELVNLHNELIDMQDGSRKHEYELEKWKMDLATKTEQNERLNSEVKTITEKNNLQLEIDKCKKKLLWIQYHEARAAADREFKKVAPKEKKFRDAEAALKPFEQQIQEFERKLGGVKEQSRRARQSYDDYVNKMKRSFEDVESCFDKVKILEKTDKMKAANDGIRATEIERLRQYIEDHTKLIAEMEATGSKNKRQMDAITADLNKYTREIETLDKEIYEMKNQVNHLNCEREAVRRQIARVENVHSQKLEVLRRRDPDAYKGVKWLEENRDKFQGRVYLPLMVEINVTDARFVNYVEAAIGYRDLNAFGCESAEDMNKLINELRTKQNLRVNIFSTNVRLVRFPQLSPKEIQQYGFDGYLDQYISCPDPIKNYLSVSSALNRIPVSHKAISLDAQLPGSIFRYYADNSSVNITKSRYSSDTITSVSRVKQASCLQIQNPSNVDAEKIRFREIEEAVLKIDAKVAELKREKDRINEISAQRRHEKNILGQHQTDLQTAKLTLGRKRGELEDLERERREFLSERKNLQKKNEDLVRKAVDKLVSLANEYETAPKVNMELMKPKLEELFARHNMKHVKRRHKALKLDVEKAEGELAAVRNDYVRLKENAKRLFAEAKSGTDGYAPNDTENFAKHKNYFDTFPNTVQELETLINEKSALIACMQDVDSSIVDDYKKRTQEIQKLKKDIISKETEIATSKDRMTSVREKWLLRLNALVRKISSNFSKYYKEINCAGDVILEKGSDEHDYRNYGLSVQVSYRESAPLKKLDLYTQSGGERAVATAFYMFSLQELTKVPFRCVDEINQGMDAINEQRVYKLLMALTSAENTSQYFLLTPKLIKDIQYADSCMVHCVYNGPHVLPSREWNIDSFIGRRMRTRE